MSPFSKLTDSVKSRVMMKITYLVMRTEEQLANESVVIKLSPASRCSLTGVQRDPIKLSVKCTRKSEMCPNHQLPTNLPKIWQEIQTRTFSCFKRGVVLQLLFFSLFSPLKNNGEWVIKHWTQMEGIKLGIKWHKTKQIPGAEENPGCDRNSGLSNMYLNEADLRAKCMGVKRCKMNVWGCKCSWT